MQNDWILCRNQEPEYGQRILVNGRTEEICIFRGKYGKMRICKSVSLGYPSHTFNFQKWKPDPEVRDA